MTFMSITNRAVDPRLARIYVAGHRGMVGSALVRALHARGYANLVTRSREELDLSNQAQVNAFMQATCPDYVFLAAAKVGGILANDSYRGDFLYQNLMIEANVIQAALEAGVRRLLFLGSSCVYPREAPQPISEESLLSGPFEPTNEPYAVAKVAGIKLCESFNRQHGTQYVSVMPSNLYGPNDNFEPLSAHALPALLRKAHEAVELRLPHIDVWGSGRPRREWLHVEDLANACVMLMESEATGGVYNVGVGADLSIRELAEKVARVVGFRGALRFDASKPDGMPRKLLDVSRIASLGWQPLHSLDEGIRLTYDWCLEHAVFGHARIVAIR